MDILRENEFLAFRLSRPLKVIGTNKDRSDTYDLLLMFYTVFHKKRPET